MGDETSSPEQSPSLCISYEGFNLHANTVVHAIDRDRLEQLYCCIQHLVIALDRLQELDDVR